MWSISGTAHLTAGLLRNYIININNFSRMAQLTLNGGFIVLEIQRHLLWLHAKVVELYYIRNARAAVISTLV